HGLFLRRSYPELEEVIRQADALFMGWKKIVDAPTYRAPSGATLSFRALQRDHDADKFQGQAYTWIGFDEATQWPSPEPLDKLRACLRSSEARIRKRMIWTANPGGVGHNWYKARYVDPAPALTPFYHEALRTWRVFIPSRLEDNPKLTESDPDYWMRVEAAAHGRRDLIKAWRHGEWDIVAGGMFDDLWRPDPHVLPPFPIPSSWPVDRAFDWGSAEPFFGRVVGGIGWDASPEWPGLSAGHALPDCGVLWLDWSTQPGTENARRRYCQEDGRTGKTDARSRPGLDSHSARTRRRLDF